MKPYIKDIVEKEHNRLYTDFKNLVYELHKNWMEKQDIAKELWVMNSTLSIQLKKRPKFETLQKYNKILFKLNWDIFI